MIDRKIFCVFGGLAMATLTGCGDAAVVVPAPLTIVSIQPTQGAINITGKKFSVAFSDPIVIPESPAQYFSLAPTGGNSLSLSAEYLQDGKYVVLSIEEDLKPSQHYELTVISPIASTKEDVQPLETTVTVQFRSADY